MAAKKDTTPKSAGPAADKKAALETALAQIEKQFGKGAVMKLGTNDAQLHMWPHIDAFKTDYQFILDSYLQLPSRPRVILVTPLKCFFPPDGKYNNERLQEVGRMVKEIALENSLECVDLFDLPDDGEPAVLMPDKLHPSSIGAGRMAARIGAVIARGTGRKHMGERRHIRRPDAKPAVAPQTRWLQLLRAQECGHRNWHQQPGRG